MTTDTAGNSSPWRLTHEEIEDFKRRAGAVRRRPADTQLWLVGDPSTHVILILSGRVKVSCQNSATGREVVLARRGAGELVGELSAIDGEARSATVTTMTEVEVATLISSRFDAFLESRPDAMRRLLIAVIRCLRDTDVKLVEFWTTTARARIIQVLQDDCLEVLAHRDDGNAGEEITLPYTHEALAVSALTTREQVTRTLGQLSRDGIVQPGTRRRIVVTNPEALLRL